MNWKTMTFTATLLSACALGWVNPAAGVPLAAMAGPIPSVALAQQDTLVIQVQRRRGGGDGDVGAGVAAGVAGALIGGMMEQAAQEQAAQEQAASAQEIANCARRYKSYDPASGTYIGRDGQPHPCPAQ